MKLCLLVFLACIARYNGKLFVIFFFLKTCFNKKDFLFIWAIEWHSDAIAMDCNLPGKVLSSVHQVTLKDCYNICKETERCTHFTWTNSNGGICLMKQGGTSKSQAFHETDLVCGITDKDVTFSAGFKEHDKNLMGNFISRFYFFTYFYFKMDFD